MQGIAGAEGQEISAKANVGYNDKEGTSWSTGILYINRGLRGMNFMYQKGTSWYAFHELGKDPATKQDDFLEKFQTAFEIMLQLFYNGYGCIYVRRYEGQIV